MKEHNRMKSWRRLSIWAILVLVMFSYAWASAETREQREIQMAEKSILGSIAVGATPKGRDLCTTDALACVGANGAELALALIGARGTPPSVEALVRLLRFRMDGALGEDYDCYVLKRGVLSKTYLKRANAEELEKECRSEVAHLVANDRQSFEGLDAGAVCSSPDQIREHIQQLVSAIGAGRRCSAEDF
jgi:immunity protein 57 of polymorphic toxin system